ncbi:hypothetical protein CSKR_107876, partial [Clonorchis sinensis]
MTARYPSYITVKLHWRSETRDQDNRKPSDRYESPDRPDEIVPWFKSTGCLATQGHGMPSAKWSNKLKGQAYFQIRSSTFKPISCEFQWKTDNVYANKAPERRGVVVMSVAIAAVQCHKRCRSRAQYLKAIMIFLTKNIQALNDYPDIAKAKYRASK